MTYKTITYPIAQVSMFDLATVAHKLLGGTDKIFSKRPDKTHSHTAQKNLYSAEISPALLDAFTGNYNFSKEPQDELYYSTEKFFNFLLQCIEKLVFIIQRDADMHWLQHKKLPILDYICLIVSMIALKSDESRKELVKTCPSLYLYKSIKDVINNKGDVTLTIKKTIRKYLNELRKGLPKSKISLYNKIAKFDEVTNRASSLATVYTDIQELKANLQKLQPNNNLSEEQEHLIQVLWGNYNALLTLSRLRSVATEYHLGSEKELLEKLYEYAILNEAIKNIKKKEDKYLFQAYDKVASPKKAKPSPFNPNLALEAYKQSENKKQDPKKITQEYIRLLSSSKAKSLILNKGETLNRVNSYIRLSPLLHAISEPDHTTEGIIAIIYPLQIAQMLYVFDYFEKHELTLLKAYPSELERCAPVMGQLYDCLQALKSSNKAQARELIISIAPTINEQPHFLRKIIAVLYVGLSRSDQFTVQNNSLTKYIDAYISTTIPTTEHRSLEKKLQEYVSSQLKQSDEKYGIFYGLVQIVRKYNQLILKHNLDVEALLCNPFDKIEFFLQKFFEAFNSLNNDLDTLQRSLQALKNLKNPLKKAKITALSYDILHLTDPYMLQLLKLDQLNAPEYTGTTWTRHFLAQSSNIRQDMLSAFKERLSS